MFVYVQYKKYLHGVKGKFTLIWPGNYEIICCIKLVKYNYYLSYDNQLYNQDHGSETSIQCCFHALAENGLDCWCHEIKWITNGPDTIKVSELSDIYFGLTIKLDYGYRYILLEYIQLNIFEYYKLNVLK